MELPPRYLNWKIVQQQMPDGKVKDIKLPCLPNGTVCDAHDPANHLTREQAEASPFGVAFDIRAEDGLFFLDMDKCLNPDGTWTPEATAIYSSFAGCWGEVSQSGTGLHIIGRCDPSKLEDRKRKWDGWLECYTDERFVAFGPHGWNPIGASADLTTDWTDQLLKFVPQKTNLGELPVGVDPTFTGPADDELLIDMMLKSTGGAGAAFGMRATVADLWLANNDVLSKIYPAFDGTDGFDGSAADMALMSHLAFWTGKDMPRMDRLFRRSGLMRDKYETREDYRSDTVQNAARLCNKVYDVVEKQVTLPAAEVYLTTSEMIEHFEGCVYIRDDHKVLIPDGSLLKPDQFNASYGGHIFQMQPDGTGPSKKAFEAFTENRAHKFPQANRRTFHPDKPFGLLIDGDVNMYIDPQVRRVPGDVEPFLDFLRRLLPDERDRAIILSWMAAIVQNPGKKALWAPVLQGTPGNGKSLMGKVLEYCVGPKYTHRPRAKELGTKFNGFLEGKSLIVVEEFHMNNRREILDDLKIFITETILPIRRMQQAETNVYIPAVWFFTTNHKDAVVKETSDRRYSVFFTAQQSKADFLRDFGTGYFPELWTWLRDRDGFAIIAEFLNTMVPTPEFDPLGACQFAPNTSTTEQAIRASAGMVDNDILEAAADHTVGFRGGWVSSWALDHMLRDKNVKLNRNRQREILEGLGYRLWGRAPRPIFQEENRRPMLYTTHESAEFSDYLAAQTYPGVG